MHLYVYHLHNGLNIFFFCGVVNETGLEEQILKVNGIEDFA